MNERFVEIILLILNLGNLFGPLQYQEIINMSTEKHSSLWLLYYTSSSRYNTFSGK
jgi:hypothetical protein